MGSWGCGKRVWDVRVSREREKTGRVRGELKSRGCMYASLHSTIRSNDGHDTSSENL